MPILSNKSRTFDFASLEAEVRARAAAGDGESWVFIVPNRIAQRRMERDLLKIARGRALPQLNILTLSDLANRLASTAFAGYRLIGDGESAVLIELSIRELLQAHKLSFFEGAAQEKNGSGDDYAFPIRRGTFELVVNTIRQLKESGVAPPDIESDLLKAQTKGETTEVRRARDILAIYAAYQSRLQTHDLMDTHGQMLLVNERYKNNSVGSAAHSIVEDFQAAFPHASDVFISGFYYLEPPSVKLIERLSSIPGVSILIELEEHKNNPDLFDGLIDLDKRLHAIGFRPINHRPQDTDPLSDYLGRHLFRAYDDLPEQREVLSDVTTSKIQYFAAHDAADEVEEIARRIKLLWHSDPSIREDLSQIVVATPSSEAYTPLFEEIFRRHEIPVQIADRYHLDRSPLVMGLLALLDAARTKLRKRELVRMLASPYFSFAQFGGDSFDAENLIGMLSKYKQTGDADVMTRSLTAHLQETESAKDRAENNGEYSREESEATRLRSAIRDLHRLRVKLQPLAGPLTPRAFCTALRALLSELHTPEQLLASNAVTIAAGTLESDTRTYRALVKLLEELEALFQILGTANELRSGAYFEQRLKAALIVTRYSLRQQSSAVMVTSLAQSISQPAKYVFLAGMTEGTFPAPYQPQVFLTSGLQKGERKQLLEDRVLFYQAITNFSEQLSISYPKKSGGIAEVNRSGFIDELSEIIKLEVAPKAEGIFSSNDLYRVASKLRPSMLESLEAAYPTAPWLRTLKAQVPLSSSAIRKRMLPDDSIYRGAIDPELLNADERAALEYNKSRVWSVTQLENYATCPFRFFSRDVLALGDEVEIEDGLDARDRGSALHEILRQFLISRRERNLQTIQDVAESELGAVYSEARQMAEDHFKTIASEHPFWRLDSELLLSDDKPGGGILRKFIERERAIAPYELRPRFFEVSFGGAGRAPRTPIDPTLSQDAPVDLRGLRLRGKIDRIDIPKEDADPEIKAFAIIDYKTGKETPRFSDIERGLSLQLPLYLRVAEDLLRSHYPELKGVAALYNKLLGEDPRRKLGIALKSYSEKAFEVLSKKKIGGLFESEEELAQVIDQAVAKAKTYVEGVSEGRFPLIEESLRKNCKHCPYGSVCRVNEAEEAGVLR